MKKKNRVVMEGEVTGHAHVVDECAFVKDGKVVAEKDTKITHEEHKTISLPANKYTISRQREIDPDTEEAREVAD